MAKSERIMPVYFRTLGYGPGREGKAPVTFINLTMVSNKPRLYIALYDRPKHLNTFHWAIHVSPKPIDLTSTPRPTTDVELEAAAAASRAASAPPRPSVTTKIHVAQRTEPSAGASGKYNDSRGASSSGPYSNKSYSPEVTTLPSGEDDGLLVRVLVAKVQRPDRIADALLEVPVIQQDPAVNSKTWLRDGMARLEAEGVLGTNFCRGVGWDRVEAIVVDFVRKKKDEGRFRAGQGWRVKIDQTPTFDLLTGRETVG
ncbi:MAG: FK506 binding protein proline rotamase rapamycin-binding protein [Chaenotheca gracillima]|nr:MAG: FK506 binding protein proline rotamase rapamycin-binding protein [Chaenotheca gracillima]